MASFGERVIKDLRADYKKTVAMSVLGVVFFSLVVRAVTQEEKTVSFAMDPGIVARADTASDDTEESPTETGPQKLRAPLFLSVALPFEKIDKDPFALFFDVDAPPVDEVPQEPEPLVPQESGSEEIANREEQVLSTFKVTGVTRSGRGASAMVDGQVLTLGDEYRGFILDEIGEFHVTFRGKVIRRRIDLDL